MWAPLTREWPSIWVYWACCRSYDAIYVFLKSVDSYSRFLYFKLAAWKPVNPCYSDGETLIFLPFWRLVGFTCGSKGELLLDCFWVNRVEAWSLSNVIWLDGKTVGVALWRKLFAKVVSCKANSTVLFYKIAYTSLFGRTFLWFRVCFKDLLIEDAMMLASSV